MRLPIRLANDSDAELTDALQALADRLDRLVVLAEEANALLRTASGGQAVPARPAGTGAARRRGRASSRAGRRSLHQAIEAVLRDAPHPLSAAEIAQRINEAQLFVSPRSRAPLTANQINSRVSNPHYKDRFRRFDGRIVLASAPGADEAQPSGKSATPSPAGSSSAS